MAVRIENISLKNFGPIGSLDISLKRLNVIYGQNESGKTYLVEFLLRSIFRQSSSWSIRNLPGQGRVTISGLGPKPIPFSLRIKKKIEDYWEKDELGLPPNMARLLVVKGGELGFTQSPGGINRAVLKTALTSETLLDQIREPIPKTVQSARIVEQEIIGAKRGPLKDRENLLQEISKLQNLVIRVENEYSQEKKITKGIAWGEAFALFIVGILILLSNDILRGFALVISILSIIFSLCLFGYFYFLFQRNPKTTKKRVLKKELDRNEKLLSSAERKINSAIQTREKITNNEDTRA